MAKNRTLSPGPNYFTIQLTLTSKFNPEKPAKKIQLPFFYGSFLFINFTDQQKNPGL